MNNKTILLLCTVGLMTFSQTSMAYDEEPHAEVFAAIDAFSASLADNSALNADSPEDDSEENGIQDDYQESNKTGNYGEYRKND